MSEIDRQTVACTTRSTKGRRIVFAVLVFLALVGLSACSLGIPVTPVTPASPPLVLVGVFVGTPGIGLPAIHHHGMGMPTEDEVRQFVLGHQFPGGPTTTGQPPTILGIKFISAKAASTKFQSILQGRSVGLTDTATVIDVELQGPFVISSTSRTQDAVEVFDAATGNLLFYWPSVA